MTFFRKKSQKISFKTFHRKTYFTYFRDFVPNLLSKTVEKGVKYVLSSQWRNQNDVIDIVLVSLLLTLNIFHIFFYCFYCWLWTGNYLLGMTVQIVMYFCGSHNMAIMSLQIHIIHSRKLEKTHRETFPQTNYIEEDSTKIILL